jgi:hypothetical protein
MLGMISAVVMIGYASSFAQLASMSDPAAALVLLLTVSSLMAVGSGISAFILVNVERACPKHQLTGDFGT